MSTLTISVLQPLRLTLLAIIHTAHLSLINFCFLMVKVWDRRQLVESCPCPVGVLAGHADGITHIDPRVGRKNVLKY